MKRVTLKEIKRQYDLAMWDARILETQGKYKLLEATEWLTKQRKLLDRELRRAGKVRSNFRDKKQRKALTKLSALQSGK